VSKLYRLRLNDLTAPYGGASKTKGNNMRINECCLNDIKKREQKAQDIAEARKFFVGAMALLILFAIVGNMEYNDCINLGVC